MSAGKRPPRGSEVLNRMIRRQVAAGPDLHGAPRFGRGAPEFVALRQTERQEGRRSQVEAAGRNVYLAESRLVAAEADPEPAVFIPGPGGIQRAGDDGGKRLADGGRMQLLRQFPAQRDLPPAPKRAAAVGDGAPTPETTRPARSAAPESPHTGASGAEPGSGEAPTPPRHRQSSRRRPASSAG